MAMTALATALASFNAAKNIAQAMIELRDAAAFQSKMIEFQGKILDAQSSLFAAQDERTALLEKVSQLEKEMADLKAWEAEKQRYNLEKLTYSGAVAYRIKESVRGPEPTHWLCTNCYEDGRKSILQIIPMPSMRYTEWHCSRCKFKIQGAALAEP